MLTPNIVHKELACVSANKHGLDARELYESGNLLPEVSKIIMAAEEALGPEWCAMHIVDFSERFVQPAA